MSESKIQAERHFSDRNTLIAKSQEKREWGGRMNLGRSGSASGRLGSRGSGHPRGAPCGAGLTPNGTTPPGAEHREQPRQKDSDAWRNLTGPAHRKASTERM